MSEYVIWRVKSVYEGFWGKRAEKFFRVKTNPKSNPKSNPQEGLGLRVKTGDLVKSDRVKKWVRNRVKTNPRKWMLRGWDIMRNEVNNVKNNSEKDDNLTSGPRLRILWVGWKNECHSKYEWFI